MPGMNSGLSSTNPTLVEVFGAALLHQGLIIVALLVLGWRSAGPRPRASPRPP